jgi:hypothetical protein
MSDCWGEASWLNNICDICTIHLVFSDEEEWLVVLAYASSTVEQISTSNAIYSLASLHCDESGMLAVARMNQTTGRNNLYEIQPEDPEQRRNQNLQDMHF